MTAAGRAAMLVVVAWLLGAVALLAAQGMLVPYLVTLGAATLAGLGLRALVRQQRAPSMLEPAGLPDRYQVADDLGRPLAEVVAVAEREASTGR
jgi:threonine/homoserine/homoserine lactone efflux protein